LFDLTKKEKKQIDEHHEYYVPTNVAFIPVRKASYKSITGRTIEQYQTRFCTAVGIKSQYGGFEASLEAEFRSETFRRSSHEYATIMDIIECWQLSMEDPKSALLPEAAERLAELPPTELFDKYGTHYLKSILVGARANYSCTVDTHAFQSKFKLHSVAEASYKSVVNLEAKVSTDIERAMASFRENSTIIVTTWGGNPRFARNIANGMYEQWSESTQEQPVFMGFGYEGLCPIWELCGDEGRKAVLEDAAKTHAQEKAEESKCRKFPLQDNDRIALQADNGLYLGRHTLSGHQVILADQDQIDEKATFTVKVVGGGTEAPDGEEIYLLADNHKYWGLRQFGEGGAFVIDAVRDNPRAKNSYSRLIVRYDKKKEKLMLRLASREPPKNVKLEDTWLTREVRKLQDQGDRQTLVPAGDPDNMQSQFSVIVLNPLGDD